MREQVVEVFNRLADEDSGPPDRRQTVRRRRRVSPQLVLATLALALLAAPLAVSATGDTLREGQRNPRSGDAKRETQIIANLPAGEFGTRQSNKGAGGAAVYGCRRPSDECTRHVNLLEGPAAAFVTDGQVPFTVGGAAGMVPNLNADKVDGLDAAQLTGATGPAGPKGDKGDKGDTGAISTVVTRSATIALPVADNATASTFATCNPGERLIGGGFRFSTFDKTANSLSSRPEQLTDGDEVTAWRASAIRDGAGGAATDLVVHALCAT